MPVNTYPIQPQYDDALTEADLLRAQGIEVPQNQMPINQTYQQFVPNAKDLKGLGLQEQYAQQQQQAMLEQQAAADQYQQYINNLKQQPVQTDLSPLAALADAWGVDKSNFAQSYKRPMSQAEKNAQIVELQGKLAAQRSKITEDRNAGLKAAIEAFKASKEQPLKDEELRSKIAANYALAGVKKQGKMLPEVSVQKLSDFEAGLSELSSVKQNLEQNADVFGPVKGRMGAMNPLDVKAQSVQADINRARQVIGKAVEGGVLRKEDEVKYEKMLPVLSDEPSVAVHKMRQFEAKLSQDHNRYLQNMERAGYNPQGMAQVQSKGPMGAASGGKQQPMPSTLSEEKMKRLLELRQKVDAQGE